MANLKTLIATSCVFIATAGSAQTDEWEKIDHGRSGTIWLMRPSDLNNTTNNDPKVWVKLDHTNNKTEKPSRTMQFIAFDCLNETSQILSYVDYDRAGNSLGGKSTPKNVYLFEPVVPATVLESAMRAACPPSKK
jgi:hypothetical protein